MEKQLLDNPLARQARLRMKELQERLIRVFQEFQRVADGHDVPDWTPHIHEPHESVARGLRKMAPAAHAAGALVAGGFAYVNSGVNHVLAVFSALAIYWVMAYFLDTGIEAKWTEFEFVQRFRKLYFPPFAVALASGLALGARQK